MIGNLCSAIEQKFLKL